MPKVLVVATSRKTRGGITSVVKAHETGEQWKKYHCRWIETHRDGAAWRKIWYFTTALVEYVCLLPFYDIIHIHVATTQSAKRKLIFFNLAKLLRKKILLHFHPSNEKFLYEPKVAQLYRKLFGGANKVLVLSEQWKRWLKDSLGDGVWMEHIDILYNPSPMVHRTNAQKKKQILYAGTLLKRKGYDILLEAFGEIAKFHPDWCVAFAGNPYLKDGINEMEDGKRIAKELNIEDQVRWLGWISGEKKEQVFNESSIYCLASDGEGFPMGVLDAWAYGIPCVMTPVGGIPDIVQDGVHGLLFPVGDTTRLAEALNELMENEQLRTSIIFNTDQLISTKFNVNTVCCQLNEIYKSMEKT